MPEPTPPLQEMITSALRYWERRRYTLHLILAVAFLLVGFKHLLEPAHSYAAGNLPSAEFRFSLRGLIILLFHINVVYCGVYIVDLFVQASDYRSKWIECRWMLFASIVICLCALYLP